jgi:hypothetical protein
MAQREQDPLERFFLTGNPNPNRIGCPSQEILQSVSRRRLNIPKEVFAHLAKCSECSLDVKAYRLRFERRHRRNNILFASGLFAAVLAGVVALLPQINPSHSRITRIRESVPQNVAINLWDQDIQRGTEQALKTIHVPPTSVRLIITLPRFSHPGTYQISLCHERNDASAFARAKASASSDGPREIVTVLLDLAGVAKGTYWLSTRLNEDEASDYFPVKVL